MASWSNEDSCVARATGNPSDLAYAGACRMARQSSSPLPLRRRSLPFAPSSSPLRCLRFNDKPVPLHHCSRCSRLHASMRASTVQCVGTMMHRSSTTFSCESSSAPPPPLPAAAAAVTAVTAVGGSERWFLWLNAEEDDMHGAGGQVRPNRGDDMVHCASGVRL